MGITNPVKWSEQSRALKYLFAAAFTAVFTALTYLLWPVLQPLLFLLYFPNSILVARFLGFRAALFANLLTIIAYHSLFISKTETLYPHSLLKDLIFVVMSVVMAWITSVSKSALETARESEAEFKAIFDLAGSGKAQINVNSLDFIRVNQRFCEITGYSQEELLKRKIVDLLHPDDNQFILPNIIRSATKTWTHESRFIRKDGSVVWVIMSGNKLSLNNEAPTLIATFVDITARKEAEEKLQLALQAGKMAIWETDVKTGNVKRSSLHDLLYGYPNPLPSWNYSDFIRTLHPEDRSKVQSEVERVLKEGRDTYSGEFRIIWPDGSVRWMLSKARILRDATSRKAVTLTGVLLDITEAKNFQESLIKAIGLREDFLSIASHELKTPITSIKLQLEMLTAIMTKQLRPENPPLDPSRIEGIQKMLSISNRQLDNLTGLINDLLDVTRIANGKLTLQKSRCDLSSIVREVVERFEPQIQSSGVRVSVEYADNLNGLWDRARIEQVIVNLLSNALKYGKGGKIAIKTYASGGNGMLAVEDEGIGISEEMQKRIFRRFERAVSEQQFGGLGLGLFITHEIVQAHAGTIRVESQVGKGSTFTVVLPLEEAKASVKAQ